VLVSTRRNTAAARAFFTRALRLGPSPVEVTTDRAPVYPRVIAEHAPRARHVLEQYANNVIEADHGRLKARLRPMRGLKRMRAARTITAGHAFVQNLRRGHYEIVAEQPPRERVRRRIRATRVLHLTALCGLPSRDHLKPLYALVPENQLARSGLVHS
jgi:IS6 family transposase